MHLSMLPFRTRNSKSIPPIDLLSFTQERVGLHRGSVILKDDPDGALDFVLSRVYCIV